MATLKVYGLAHKSAWNKEIDWDGGNVYAMLLTNQYTPDQDTHQYLSSVIAAQLSTVSTTLSAGASLGATSISVAASIAIGNMVLINSVDARVVTNVTGAGPYTLTLSSGLSAAVSSGQAVVANPGYTTNGKVLVSPVYGYNAGTNVLTLDADDLAWASASLNSRYVVLYDRTAGTDATRPLIAYGDFGADQPVSNSTFSLGFNVGGIVQLTAA